jgi:hypothetical protein
MIVPAAGKVVASASPAARNDLLAQRTHQIY